MSNGEDWTPKVNLQHYLERILDERDDRYEQRSQAQEKALEVASAAINRRLEGMNEFRDALRDQTASLLPRAEYTAQQKALIDRMEAMECAQNERLGSINKWLIGLLGGLIIALILTIVDILVRFVG